MKRPVVSFLRSYLIPCALLVVAVPQHTLAQQTRTAPAVASPTVVRGIYNWIHSTADSERAFPFYRDILGIELARSTFAGPAPANAPPERIRPVSDAEPDPLIWNLTDTKGSRFRNVFMRTANTPLGLELSEFFDIPRSERPANPWDPGASMLIFRVRDLDGVVAALNTSGAPSVTLGDEPVDTPAGRAILVRDPDGYLVQVTQASPSEIASATSPDQVVDVSIGISVANMAAALEFYRGLLGFDVRETRRATPVELRLNGLATGGFTQTTTVIPGTAVVVLFSEFSLPADATPQANPLQWRIQDVGAPQFQLKVTGLDALIEQTQQAGYRFRSLGAEPSQRPFGRFVFAVDPDGVLVEFVEPVTER